MSQKTRQLAGCQAEALVGAGKRASQPPFVLAPAASLIGTGPTEALMLDAERIASGRWHPAK